MKRLSFFIVAVLLAITSTFAANGNDRTITKTANGYHVKYHFADYTLKESECSPGTFNCKIEGFGVNDILGEPAYLLRNDMFVIPDGFGAQINIISSSFEEKNLRLAPSSIQIATEEMRMETIVDEINAYSGYFPTSSVSSPKFNTYRGTKLVSVAVQPTQYDMENEQLRIYKDIEYEVVFTPQLQTLSLTENKYKLKSDPNDPFFAENTLNPQDVSCKIDKIEKPADAETLADYGPFGVDQQGYLIITSPTLYSAASEIAKRKQQFGYTVTIKQSNNWTPQSVKDAIIEECKKSNLDYVLFLGDDKHVPCKKDMYTNDAEHTFENINYDYWYGLIEDDEIPSIRRGRIPVSTLTEANQVNRKLGIYELKPSTNDSYYSTDIHCGSFIDDQTSAYMGKGYEDTPFIYTLEQFSKAAIQDGITVKREYNAYSFQKRTFTPSYWSRSIYPAGKRITSLEMPGYDFKWDADSITFLNAYKSGARFIVYNGHATKSKWAPLMIHAKDIKKIDNFDYFPIVFSTGCHTGAYNLADNVVNAFMNHSRGAIGMIAPTGNVNYGLSNAILTGMLSSFYSSKIIMSFNFGLFDSSTINLSNKSLTLGHVLDRGLAVVRIYSNNQASSTFNTTLLNRVEYYYHCFGDPAMQIYTAKPTAFTNVRPSMTSNNYVNIVVGDNADNVVICVWDKNENECRRVYSKSVMVKFSGDYTITITGKNKIPFVLNYNAASGFSKNEKTDTRREYASLIREDRIWEYVDNDDSDVRRIIRMKFDGTKEIDGNTYHILNSIYAQGGALVRTQADNKGVFDAVTPIAYMREENGRVWMRRIPGTEHLLSLAGGFFIGGSHFGTIGTVGSTEQDYLLYDFSADEGDIVNTLCMFDAPEKEGETNGHLMGLNIWYKDNDQYLEPTDTDYSIYDFCNARDESINHRKDLKDWEYCVSELTDLVIDSQDKMTDSPEYHGSLRQQRTCWFDAVEGVGCLRGGTLCFPGTEYWWTDGWGEPIYLNRVYDTAMNVVFGNPMPECPQIDTSASFAGIKSAVSDVSFIYNDNIILIQAEGEIGITLFGANGDTIISRSGENEVSVSTTGLSAGVYVAIIKSGDKTEAKKILVK